MKGGSSPLYREMDERHNMQTVIQLQDVRRTCNKTFLDKVKERVERYGASESEIRDLFAIIAGRNNPEIANSLSEFHVRDLMNMSIEDFKEIDGITNSVAERLVAAIALSKKLARAELPEYYTIRSPEDAAYYLNWMRHEEQEKFVCLYLNMKNQVIREKVIFIGSLNASIVHPRECFKEAVKCSAASIICAHQHPSGDPSPSQEDIQVTRRLAEAGKVIGIEVLDHVVIGDKRFVSLKEKGYL